MRIRISGTFTVTRAVAGMLMYWVGVLLVWPPSLGQAIVLAVCCGAFVALFRRVEVEI